MENKTQRGHAVSSISRGF